MDPPEKGIDAARRQASFSLRSSRATWRSLILSELQRSEQSHRAPCGVKSTNASFFFFQIPEHAHKSITSTITAALDSAALRKHRQTQRERFPPPVCSQLTWADLTVPHQVTAQLLLCCCLRGITLRRADIKKQIKVKLQQSQKHTG